MGRYQVTSTAAVKESLLNRANGEDLAESLPRAWGPFGGTRVGDVGVVGIYGDLRGSFEDVLRAPVLAQLRSWGLI